ncbi:MAG: hypothetical protein AMJ79_15590 [Phycisphaerae bacterium SM23_30]|nr:MAG: hypothetical protein AMJ79_15590 [Phycisphaerae bacterium SM23_30]
MDISAFRGYRYDSSAAGDGGACIAPPYDIIDADQQQQLYDRSEYNIVRVIKGKIFPDDTDRNNVYTRAAAALRGFIEKGALKQDEAESIYVYAQDFTVGSEGFRRSGFIALGKLEAYGGNIRAHEQTLSGPKADRLNLMRATKSQIGQIFMLYSDPAKTIDAILARACEGPELLRYNDDEQVAHRLFAITEPARIEAIKKAMADKSIFIADGHHRFETALNYYNETQNPAAAYRMMTFVNTHNEGLVVLPTHRLVKKVKDFDPARLVERLKGQFDVATLSYRNEEEKGRRKQQMLDALAVEQESNENALGMYFNDGGFYVATLKDKEAMVRIAPEHSAAWRKLDVTILHKLILEQYLGIDEAALTAQTNVEYIKDIGGAVDRAMARVDSGTHQGLFFMNRTRPQEVEAVAAAGEKMPQKSTFFFPKIFSGLVVNVLGE